MHYLSNRNNPQGQWYLSSLKDFLKSQSKKSLSCHCPRCCSCFYFLSGMCNAKGLKNAFQAPAPNPTGKSEAKRKRKEHKLVAESRWLSLAPYGYFKCWWMTGTSRNSALILAPKCTQEENMQSPMFKESSPPLRVTEHEVDSIWRWWTGQMECWHHSL